MEPDTTARPRNEVAAEEYGMKDVVEVAMANRKQATDFIITITGESWRCEAVYVRANGTPAWFECAVVRDGVRFTRDFGPEELAGKGVAVERLWPR